MFHLVANFYYWTLVEEKVNLIIWNTGPHVSGELVLYELAKILNIPTLILEQSIIPNHYFHYTEIYDYGNFTTSVNTTEYSKKTIIKKAEKDLFYMKSTFGKKNLLQKAKLRFSPEYRLVKEFAAKRTRLSSLTRYFYKKKYRQNREKFIPSQTPDLNKKFVYFPLHMQPEKTVDVWGGKFADQAYVVELLSAFIPDDWVIYIKENPKQGYMFRDESFFKRIKKIKNAAWVPNNTNTYELIKKSQFVTTVTGTVGWEAISGGKNVLTFGWGVWYKSLPGVFQWNNQPTLDEILAYEIDHEVLERAFSELSTKLSPGIIYKPFKEALPSFNEEENLNTVEQSLTKILDQLQI